MKAPRIKLTIDYQAHRDLIIISKPLINTLEYNTIHLNIFNSVPFAKNDIENLGAYDLPRLRYASRVKKTMHLE